MVGEVETRVGTALTQTGSPVEALFRRSKRCVRIAQVNSGRAAKSANIIPRERSERVFIGRDLNLEINFFTVYIIVLCEWKGQRYND